MLSSTLIFFQRSNETHALPVNMLCKDETGKLVDISEHLVQKGLALRRRRFGYFLFSFKLSYSHPSQLISKAKMWMVLYCISSTKTCIFEFT